MFPWTWCILHFIFYLFIFLLPALKYLIPFNLFRDDCNASFPGRLVVIHSGRHLHPSVHTKQWRQSAVCLLGDTWPDPQCIDCQSTGQSIFRSICLSGCLNNGFSVKIKLKFINNLWNGEIKCLCVLVMLLQAWVVRAQLLLSPAVHWVWVMMNPVLTPHGELSIH